MTETNQNEVSYFIATSMDVYGIGSSGSKIAYNKFSINFRELSSASIFDRVGLIVLPHSIGLKNLDHRTPPFQRNIRGVVEKLNLARRGGSHVLVLLDDNFQTIAPLFKELLPKNCEITQDESKNEITSDDALVDEFLRVYGNPLILFSLETDENPDLKPILYAPKSKHLVKGIVDTSCQGLLFILPIFALSEAYHEFFQKLITPLSILIDKSRTSESPIVDDFKFSKEQELFTTKSDLEDQIQLIEQQLSEYRRRKSILYLRDDELANTLPDWFTYNLGIPARREEEFKEDFWLCDENGTDIVICEAKALDKNVKDHHVTELIGYRQLRDLPEEFPALLVANTFAKAGTTHTKDKQVIPPKVILKNLSAKCFTDLM